MDRLRRSFRDSFRRRKDRMPDSLKPYQWQADETAVRNGTCTFQVKYLGCVEVFESRGMPICEEALKILRASRRRPIRSVLHVGGDGLRVVEEDTKGLLVDQTIEKVSFCAPDKNFEKGFSYICRDGTTRRWMCHGFLAVRETGERLSHAVGCAFAVCLERKQRRDKECAVTMAFDNKNATFTRSGSFRKSSLTEQEENQQIENNNTSTVLNQNNNANRNPFAIERPHATPLMLERQSSFRGFSQLAKNSSPFKRQMSLRITDLPSNSERQKIFFAAHQSLKSQDHQITNDSVAALCQQLTKGLSKLSNSNNSINEHEPKIEEIFDPLNITTASININFNNNISNNFCHITGKNQDTANEIGAINNKSTVSSPDNSNGPSPKAASSNNNDSSHLSPSVSLSLPKPDQWLGAISSSIATNTTPKLSRNSSAQSSPKKPSHSRAISFDENFSRSPHLFSMPSPTSSMIINIKDPFDVEWADLIAVKHDYQQSQEQQNLDSSLLNADNDTSVIENSNVIIPKNTTNPFLVSS